MAIILNAEASGLSVLLDTIDQALHLQVNFIDLIIGNMCPAIEHPVNVVDRTPHCPGQFFLADLVLIKFDPDPFQLFESFFRQPDLTFHCACG